MSPWFRLDVTPVWLTTAPQQCPGSHVQWFFLGYWSIFGQISATWLSYFAKEQSSRNVSIELLFLFCSQPHYWSTNIWWTRRASRKLPSLFHPLRKQSYWSQMIPCYHFGNNTDDIMFSQWMSLSKRIDPKLTDDQKEELSDIIIKDPSTSLDHIHWRNDNIILPKCKWQNRIRWYRLTGITGGIVLTPRYAWSLVHSPRCLFRFSQLIPSG